MVPCGPLKAGFARPESGWQPGALRSMTERQQTTRPPAAADLTGQVGPVCSARRASQSLAGQLPTASVVQEVPVLPVEPTPSSPPAFLPKAITRPSERTTSVLVPSCQYA